MFEQWEAYLLSHIPDALIYGTMVVLLFIGFRKCLSPIAANARALRRATRILKEEGKMQMARPTWNDLHFLGRRLQGDWANFLQNAELMDLYSDSCDVEDYINADTAVYNVANTPLAELIPGVMVSLGILGTFLGITTGLSGLDTMGESAKVFDAILTLIGGMQVAFLTSICGILASMLFNFANRLTIGRALRALNNFVDVFQQYGMPKPPNADTKMLAIQQQQSEYLRTFVEEICVRTANQIEQGMMRALLPVQRSMDNFIIAATQEQVEGVDRIAARFVERLDLVMEGRLRKLGDTLERLNAGHAHAQEDLQTAYAAVAAMTQDAAKIHALTQQALDQFAAYVGDVDSARQEAYKTNEANAELLESIHQTAQQQAKYLTKLSEHQAALQDNMAQYTTWADQFFHGTQKQTQETSRALEGIAGNLQDSAGLLQTAYQSFVESVQEGLARALALFDESVATSAKQIASSVSGMKTVVEDMPKVLSGSARKYSGQVDQFVEALTQLQRSMQSISESLEAGAAKREVG